MNLQRAIDLMVKGQAYETPFDAQVIEEVARVVSAAGFMREGAFKEAAKLRPISVLLQLAQFAERGGNTFGMFTFADSGAVGDIPIYDTFAIPGYDIEGEPEVTGLSWPNLLSIDPLQLQGVAGGYLIASGNPKLVRVSAPQLAVVGQSIFCNDDPLLSDVDFRSVVSVGGWILFQNDPSLVTLDLHSLVTLAGRLDCVGSTSLANLDVSSWVPTDNKPTNLQGTALTASSVQGILRRFVLAGVSNCVIDLSGGTAAGTSSLNAQGQADVATLGAQLTINP